MDVSDNWEFALVNAEGQVLDVAPTAADAAGALPRKNPYYPIAQQSILDMDELVHLTEEKSTGKKAFEWSSLEQVSGHEILDLTRGLEDPMPTFQRLRPYFEHMRGQNWASPEGMMESILGGNDKVDKPAEGINGTITGLTLVPFWRNTQDEFVRRAPHNKKILQQLDQDDQFCEDPVPRENNWCAGSSWACRRGCLLGTGKNYAVHSFKAKFAKAMALKQDPVAFLSALAMNIHGFSTTEFNQGRTPFVRLNMLSDIPWEIVCPDLFALFPDVQFYDYTKVNVAKRKIPSNYDLTFSFSGLNKDACRAALEAGHRVAVVFVSADPTRSPFGPRRKDKVTGKPYGKMRRIEFWEIQEDVGKTLKNPFSANVGHVPVIDGEVSDFRAADPAPSIVALSYKEPKGFDKVQEKFIRYESGFVVSVVPVKRLGDALVTPSTPWQNPLLPSDE